MHKCPMPSRNSRALHLWAESRRRRATDGQKDARENNCRLFYEAWAARGWKISGYSRCGDDDDDESGTLFMRLCYAGMVCHLW